MIAVSGAWQGVPEAIAAPKADDTVYLPVSRLRVPVPGRVANWVVESMSATHDGSKMDLLRTADNVKPSIGFVMQVASDPGGCALPLNLALGSFPAGTRKVQRPSYLPASFVPEAIESPLDGGKGIVACANIPGGDVVVRIVYKGKRLENDLAPLRPTLDSIAKQAATRPPPAPPAPTPRTAPTPPPAPRLSATSITLGTSGATVRLPEGWRHEFLNEMQQPGRDLLIRKLPGGSELGIAMEPPNRERNCTEWYQAFRNRAGSQMRERPSYAPPGYFHAVLESSNQERTVSKATLCLDTKDNGLQDVTLVYEGSLDDPDVREAYPLLDQIATSILAVPRVPDLPASSPPSASTIADASASSARQEELARKRRAEENRYRAPSSSYHSDRSSRRTFTSSRVELSGYQVEPSNEAYEKAKGGSVGVQGLIVDPGTFAFAGIVGASVGGDSSGNIPIDLKAGLGAGLRVGPLMLIPLFELGADSMGGGDADKYKVPAAFNYAVEGIARLALGDGFGIGGSAARLFRGSMLGSANSEVPKEDRLSAHVYLKTVSLGVRFVDYGTGKLTAGTLGLAF